MNIEFILNIDKYKSPLFLYMFLLLRIPLILLLVFSSRTSVFILMVIILVIQCSLLFALVSHNVKLPFQLNFNRTTEIFSNSVMLIILMIVTIDKVVWVDLSYNIAFEEVFNRMQPGRYQYSRNKPRISSTAAHYINILMIFISCYYKSNFRANFKESFC